MSEFRNRIRSDWPNVLRGILTRAARQGEQAVLAFDLDSTVFDNRPRQARILREYGALSGRAALERCQPEHWTSGWDMKAAMVSCGLPAAEAEALYPDAKRFWAERFFTSPYCVDDVPIRGAPEFLAAVVETGATLAYVTGRHEEMRDGSVEAMRRHKMALPGGRVHLIMKPTLKESDDDFKRVAHQKLRGLGQVLAAFDNEPIHVNDYVAAFPAATVVHLATDHSGRPVEVSPAAVTIPYFAV